MRSAVDCWNMSVVLLHALIPKYRTAPKHCSSWHVVNDCNTIVIHCVEISCADLSRLASLT